MSTKCSYDSTTVKRKFCPRSAVRPLKTGSQRFRNVTTAPSIYTLVWLDKNVNISVKNIETHAILRSFNDQLKVFIDSDGCLDYIMNMDTQKIIFIVSGSCGHQIITRVHNMTQLQAIYIFCFNNDAVEGWTKEHHKIRGVYFQSKDLVAAISTDQHVREHVTNNDIVIDIYNAESDESESENRNAKNANFMYFQLLIDNLLKIQSDNLNSIAKQDLIDHFKLIYQGNSAQERIITEFENDYRPENAIWWYTRPTFIYYTLNKALRESDYEVLSALRFFIGDLYHQLVDEHQKSLRSHQSSDSVSCVYRGQAIEVKELNFIRRNVGQFLSMQNFLSTSTDRQVALFFAEMSTPPTIDTTRILFQFNIDTHISNTKPYANIKDQSFIPGENEILFMLGSIFRIEQIEYNETEHLWVSILSLCSEEVYELKNLMEHMKKEFGDDASSLGWILYNQGEYERGRNVFQQLLVEPSTSDFDRARCYHGLGSAAKELNEYDLALENYKNEVEIWRKLNEKENIGVTYRTIGEVHYLKNEIELAFSYEQKALDILLPLNHPKLSKVYRAIGNIHLVKNEFDLAIEEYEKSLTIDLRYLPGDHASFGITYAYIGVAQENKGDYEHAVESFVKAGQVYEKALPPNHPRILDLKENINRVKYKLNHK